MDIKTLVGLGFIVFASLTTQLPQVLFRYHQKMTGRALAEAHPGLAWMRFTYPILSILWFLLFGGLPIFLIINSTKFLLPFGSILYILGAAIGSISILHGLLGLITNVCPLPQKRNRQYVYDEEMHFTALLIIAVGVFVAASAMALMYFHAGLLI